MSERSVQPLKELCNIDAQSGAWKLKNYSIVRVERVETNTSKSAQYKGPYTERQTPYMILLQGEKRWRRVYATPIGNVSSMYFKVYNTAVPSGVVFCELALDEALHRPGD
jgi:hypothetical protein